MKKIAIIYLSFHCEPYIDDVVKAMETVTYSKEDLEFIIVDNPHPQHGNSTAYLEAHVLPKSEKSLPKVTILEQTDDNTFIVMADDGQTAIVTSEDIERLRKIGNLHEINTEQKENL